MQDLDGRVPEMPCAAPFAAVAPGSLALQLHRSFFQKPAAAGRRAAAPRPKRLLARCRGRFLADVDLSAHRAAHQKVRVFTILLQLHDPVFPVCHAARG